MFELLSLAPPFAAGLVLGAIFFGGLWWTVRRGLGAAQPALWFFGGLLLRMGVAGFVAARLAVHRLTRATPSRQGQEINSAS